MSTTGSSNTVAPEAGAETEHSDLVSRLVAEAFTQFGRKAEPPAAPARQPDISNLDPAQIAPNTGGAIPPVHPAAPAEAAKPAPAQGAQVEGKTHPYGEPRCYGNLLQSRPREAKTANGNPLLGLSPAESFNTPEFYFLRREEVSGKSPLAAATYPRTPTPVPTFGIEAVRRDFPALHQEVNGRPLIWLDNAATTHKPQAVIDATAQFYSRDNSNIHRAAHTLAARSTEWFESGREKVRQFLGGDGREGNCFCARTTEGINLVAQSYGRKNIGAGDEIILTELEHHANIVPWQLLAEQVGAVLRVVPINDRGELILEEYVKLLGPKTKFVSVAHVSNSLGTVNPVEEIIALAHARGVPVLVDGAQSTPAPAGERHGARRRFLCVFRAQNFWADGHWRRLWQGAVAEAMPPWQGGGT